MDFFTYYVIYGSFYRDQNAYLEDGTACVGAKRVFTTHRPNGVNYFVAAERVE